MSEKTEIPRNKAGGGQSESLTPAAAEKCSGSTRRTLT